jgi:pilus assembly protein CpaB
MKPKTLILIVAAVGCGLAASYMTSRLIAQRAQQHPEEEKVAVVVARQKVAMGTLIKNPEQLFVLKEFSKGTEPKKAITDLKQLKDKRLNKPLSGEQFVTSDDLLGIGDDEMSRLVPPGMRAVAIRANMESSGGGFVLPNSRVDLVVTVKRGEQDSWARIVMQNMLVLAVDLMKERNPEKDAHIPSVVTLAATPEEAEKLRMAQAMGEISMILRPFGEEQAVHTRGVKPRDVQHAKGNDTHTTPEGNDEAGIPTGVANLPFPEGKPPLPPPPAPEVKPEPPQTHTILIENGQTITKAVYVIDKSGKVSSDIERQDPAPKPEKSAPPRPDNNPGAPAAPQGPPASQPGA